MRPSNPSESKAHQDLGTHTSFQQVIVTGTGGLATDNPRIVSIQGIKAFHTCENPGMFPVTYSKYQASLILFLRPGIDARSWKVPRARARARVLH